MDYSDEQARVRREFEGSGLPPIRPSGTWHQSSSSNSDRRRETAPDPPIELLNVQPPELNRGSAPPSFPGAPIRRWQRPFSPLGASVGRTVHTGTDNINGGHRPPSRKRERNHRPGNVLPEPERSARGGYSSTPATGVGSIPDGHSGPNRPLSGPAPSYPSSAHDISSELSRFSPYGASPARRQRGTTETVEDALLTIAEIVEDNISGHTWGHTSRLPSSITDDARQDGFTVPSSRINENRPGPAAALPRATGGLPPLPDVPFFSNQDPASNDAAPIIHPSALDLEVTDTYQHTDTYQQERYAELPDEAPLMSEQDISHAFDIAESMVDRFVDGFVDETLESICSPGGQLGRDIERRYEAECMKPLQDRNFDYLPEVMEALLNRTIDGVAALIGGERDNPTPRSDTLEYELLSNSVTHPSLIYPYMVSAEGPELGREVNELANFGSRVLLAAGLFPGAQADGGIRRHLHDFGQWINQLVLSQLADRFQTFLNHFARGFRDVLDSDALDSRVWLPENRDREMIESQHRLDDAFSSIERNSVVTTGQHVPSRTAYPQDDRDQRIQLLIAENQEQERQIEGLQWNLDLSQRHVRNLRRHLGLQPPSPE
ncbi:hypothetical protein IAU59_005051 [Kwoniella sp. CBS 9459]